MLFALLHKNKLLGLYNNFDKCSQMQNGLVANNFAKSNDFSIVTYYTNSICVHKNKDTNSNFVTENIIENTTSDNTATHNNNKNNNNKINSSYTKKESKIKYNLSLLQKKKEEIEESKTVYKVDFNLFTKFKKICNENPNFIIPDLFQKKYSIMEKLDQANNLSWETFNAIYVKENIPTTFDNLFELGGGEKKLLNISDTTEDESTESED